jgi:hypothetical protein
VESPGYRYAHPGGGADLRHCDFAPCSQPVQPKGQLHCVDRQNFISIYLVHGIVLDYLPTQKIPDKLDTPSFVLVVLMVSYFTERFIERPGTRFSKAIATFRGPAQPNYGTTEIVARTARNAAE